MIRFTDKLSADEIDIAPFMDLRTGRPSLCLEADNGAVVVVATLGKDGILRLPAITETQASEFGLGVDSGGHLITETTKADPRSG